jgi:hypothetical protein
VKPAPSPPAHLGVISTPAAKEPVSSMLARSEGSGLKVKPKNPNPPFPAHLGVISAPAAMAPATDGAPPGPADTAVPVELRGGGGRDTRVGWVGWGGGRQEQEQAPSRTDSPSRAWALRLSNGLEKNPETKPDLGADACEGPQCTPEAPNLDPMNPTPKKTNQT